MRKVTKEAKQTGYRNYEVNVNHYDR